MLPSRDNEQGQPITADHGFIDDPIQLLLKRKAVSLQRGSIVNTFLTTFEPFAYRKVASQPIDGFDSYFRNFD